MSAIEDYLHEMDGALRVRGPARRRLLAELKDHLVDASAVHGEVEAVRRFGAAPDVAHFFDTEVAARRAVSATLATVVGVLAVGASALVVLNAADPRASAVSVWAVVFFASAQTAMVCTVLAALRAAAVRSGPATTADVALLCRRNGSALAAALLALFAAGAAVPGQATALLVLLGPAVAAFATVLVVRTRALAKRFDDFRERTVRDPLADLRVVTHLGVGSPRRLVLLVAAVVTATGGAFLWDHLDHGTLETSMTAASIEAGLTLVGYLLLGPSLGLRPGIRRRSGLVA